MKFVGAMVAAAVLLAAGGAQAQDPAAFDRGFCHGLKGLVRAAPDFESIWRAHPAPPSLGFRPDACRVMGKEDDQAWICHQRLAPDHLSTESLAAQTAACLPEAKRLPARSRGSREASFELPGVRIKIWDVQPPNEAVGRLSTYLVWAE